MGFLDFLHSIINVFFGKTPPEEKTTGAQRPPRPTPPRRPVGQQEHYPRKDTDGRTFQAQYPERPQPQPDRPLYQDRNQSNQQNDYYANLRAKANQQGDEMARCFKESHEAYERHERALAKELSEKGKEHERTMEALNAEASAWIFRENNTDSKPGESDLHGLYVKEAISYAERAIKEAQRRGDSQARFIVGKGLHSGNGAKIKPALEKWMGERNLATEVDPQNAGVLIVQLA